MNLNKLYKDLGFDVETQDPMEFSKPDNVAFMPLKCYINMSERHATTVQLTNLIETYGPELVTEMMVTLLKEKYE